MRVIPCVCVILAALVAFSCLQKIFVPKYPGDVSSITAGFYELEEDSLDAVFLGPSQMFCSLNPAVIDEYGISSYDFGGSAQHMVASYLYAKEALKTQSPKVILCDICSLLIDPDVNDPTWISWSYDTLPFSVDKVRSLYHALDGDISRTIAYAFPLLQYHNRWEELTGADFSWFFTEHPNETRGFLDRPGTTEVQLSYENSYTGQLLTIPEKNMAALRQLAELCQSRNIRLVLYKAPSDSWTKDMSASIQAAADEMDVYFLNCMEHLEEIGFDASTDFSDSAHLNGSGANKVSAYVGQYLAAQINEPLF